MLKLPVEAKTLATALSEPLAASNREAVLHVEAVSLQQGASAEDATITMLVVAIRQGNEAAERWHVKLPLSAQDLEGEVSPQAFIVTVRANLEEWWHTKGFDPVTATQGTRVDPDIR